MQRVFIYGSCVTRDAEPWFGEYGFEMARYVARQSLISAFHKAKIAEYDLSPVESAFQRRMIKGDVASNLRSEIQGSEPDLVVWDICDERAGVKKAKSGGLVTSITNHVRRRIHPGPFGKIIPFGADAHFAMWQMALGKFLVSLDQCGLADKLVLNATPWALQDESGLDLGEVPRLFNANSERYISEAETAGVHVARIAPEAAVARSDHKWGPAPFHFVDETYRAQLDAISALV
ncbi:DUF6270 domain-containing protein [Brachybacterium tyrofermentans]|uniref:DUF6270 domain-containing protein n=1 Tax=Brachybacterium tyrofermentans TaxID=47848 RepID=UPI003FD616D1